MIVSVLGYGYWHSFTHASFYVSLNVESKTDYETTSMPGAELEFLNSNGNVLANGVADKQYNIVHLIHPKYGDCHEVEKMAAFSKEARTSWQVCFGHQSTWIATWISDVDKVNVKYGNCLNQDRPITVTKSESDWYLWWVPHPHIGGKPYANYSSTITINENDCVGN